MRPKPQSHSKKSSGKVKTVIKTSLLLVWNKIINHKLITIICLVIILFLAILIWTFTSLTNIIVGGGSTSVNDVMVDTTNAYHKKTGHDVLYNSLGSAAALVGVKNGSYNFGFLSEDIPDKNGKNNVDAVSLWNNNSIIRFAIAQDYIMLVYHAPTGCSINGSALNFVLTNSENTIQKIYLNHESWGNVFGSQMTCSTSVDNTSFFTLTRESGSGTRQFFDNSLIKTTNYRTNQVATSNGDMFQTIQNTPNSIGYLSFSFLNNIRNSSLSIKAIGSVTDQYSTAELPYNPATYSFNSNYPEVRPFTGIMGNVKRNPALDFITWLIDPIPYYMYEIKENDATALAAYLKTSEWLDSAAYWYIDNGARPLSVRSSYSPHLHNTVFSPLTNQESIYNYYNNNQDYLRNLMGPNSIYESIYILSYNKLTQQYKNKIDETQVLTELHDNSYKLI